MADDDKKALVRILKQADRDLQTARELLRSAIQSGGEALSTKVILSRLQAATVALESVDEADAKAGV